MLILGEHPSVPSRPSCTAVVRCARTICVPRHLTSAVSIGPTVWISTFAQRCIEHGELVDSCAERLEASQPKTGEPCPVPVGTVATYGPGLAPLEYARLTGLMNRYAVTESGGASDAERTSEGQIEHGALSDVHAPWQGNGTVVSSPSTRLETAADNAEKKTAAAQKPPGVPSPARAPAQTPSPSRGVVYPRHLPELKVQKLPKCVLQLVFAVLTHALHTPHSMAPHTWQHSCYHYLIVCCWLSQRAVGRAVGHSCLSCIRSASIRERRRWAVTTTIFK